MKTLFATKVWEKDWQPMVAFGFDNKLASCDFPFTSTMLVVNNGVPSLEPLQGLADYLYSVDQHAAEVLEFFKLKPEDFQGGYNYSIAELMAIYFAKDFDYLCYVQGDSITKESWVQFGIDTLEDHPDVSVVSPASDCNTWHNPITKKDQFFSDQGFLVRVNEFRKPIYSEPGVIADYPPHGGNSFEHMVAKYLRKANKYRYIEEAAWLIHPGL